MLHRSSIWNTISKRLGSSWSSGLCYIYAIETELGFAISDRSIHPSLVLSVTENKKSSPHSKRQETTLRQTTASSRISQHVSSSIQASRSPLPSASPLSLPSSSLSLSSVSSFSFAQSYESATKEKDKEGILVGTHPKANFVKHGVEDNNRDYDCDDANDDNDSQALVALRAWSDYCERVCRFRTSVRSIARASCPQAGSFLSTTTGFANIALRSNGYSSKQTAADSCSTFFSKLNHHLHCLGFIGKEHIFGNLCSGSSGLMSNSARVMHCVRQMETAMRRCRRVDVEDKCIVS